MFLYRPQLARLVIAELGRRLAGRIQSGPVRRWRFSGPAADRVLIAPMDLRVADPFIADEFYAGRIPLAGRYYESGGVSPFSADIGDRHFLAELHAFRWLRHMRARDSDLAFAHSRALVADWIGSHGQNPRGLAWQPNIAAERLIAWLSHSPTILSGADAGFHRRFLRSLAFQTRYLKTATSFAADGEERLKVRIALAFSSLALPTRAGTIRSAAAALAHELDRQILPDGGHVSRNPQVILDLLMDLLPLRQSYSSQAEMAPGSLLKAVDRMLPAVRFFRHTDGATALFNGAGRTDPDRILSVLRYDPVGGAVPSSAPHSGYERLSSGKAVVLVECGKPPSSAYSREAHAGCLSFEFSHASHRFIVNMGSPLRGSRLRESSRATAAHSTASLNDMSSCRFASGEGIAGLIGRVVVSGPVKVPVNRIATEDGGQGITARHDGYAAPLGYTHQRSLLLRPDGLALEGEDRFERTTRSRGRRKSTCQATIRFHLHPMIEARRQSDRAVGLTAPDGSGFLFECEESHVSLEDSLYLAGVAGPRATRQLVISLDLDDRTAVTWKMVAKKRHASETP